MTVWLVRDRKYWNVLEVCSTKLAAIQYIKSHGKTDEDWIYQEKLVREEKTMEVPY